MKQPDPNPVETYLSGLSSRNERTAREALNLLAERIEWSHAKSRKNGFDGLEAPWWQLTGSEVADVHEHLTSGEWIPRNGSTASTTSATINRYLTALRGVLRQCWKQDLMTADVYLQAVARLKSVPPGPPSR